MASFLVCLLLVGTCILGVAGTNLLGNGDFEAATLGTYWSKSGCSWAISTSEKRGGAQSVHITGRSNNWAGLGYFIATPAVESDKLYAFVGHIKLENLVPGHLYHDVYVKLRIETLDGSKTYTNIGIHPRVRPGSWQEVGGDFKLPNNVKEIKIYIQIEEKDVNYFFDDGSLTELVPDPNWRSKAESNIDLYRKVTLNILVRKIRGISLKGVTIEVEQKRSDFGHGTAVKAKLWTNSSYDFYNDFVYNTLKPEWGVPANALKWKGMRWSESKLKFDDANETLNDLLDHGLSVRGHNVFWSVEEFVPDWVRSITDPVEMATTIKERISEAVTLTKGRLAHWDVNNENLHSDFFERTTGNVDITMDMFREMHLQEPNTKLFLNDFAVFNKGTYTTSLKNQARSFVDSQVPIHGVGVQSHFKSADVDMTRLKYRLDKVAEAGPPIWVTELSIRSTNNAAKAQAMEEAMTMYFSHEKVEGIIVWGFWGPSIKWPADTLTTDAIPIVLNEAGQKYLDLVNTTWRTNWSAKLKSHKNKRHFKGDYCIRIKKDGVTLKTINFSLLKDRNLKLRVKGTTDSPKIKVKLT
ncbi:uncharacterized protein LOC110445814 [Mizuhopecten yessoensis]|uniref:uncharacterized protein LOC110445814 n=1 Tax=Mizuhopecten yessoensis TaxID=6573 RepID=UPI000B459A03|nr:uncharacterized protein LOC110445814 [Mizuhopecten yessoensis]XP_021346286.1 uncharacterized protein LOC110445814 [Mizuhopecten yessoensis]